MVGTMIPAAAFAAQETINTPLLADFTFDDDASVLAGGNAKATVNGSYQLKDSKDAASGKALYLDGNASNYLSVTDKDGKSLLAGKKEITVSYDAKPDRTATSWVFYAAPNTDAQKSPEYYIGAFANSGNTKVERYNNGRTVGFETKTGTDWSHVDIVYSEGTTAVYVDGVKRVSVDNSNAQLPDILGASGILYIGRANWGNGESYKGWIDNFKIYDGALTDAQLITEEAAKKAVEADKAALTLPQEIISDFTLPSKGTNYTNITWAVEENDNAVIQADGYQVKVVRPAEQDAEVTFTATIELQGVKDKKEIAVKIPKEISDEAIVEEAYGKLDIATKDDVRGNITLPTEMEVSGTVKKAQITWESSDKAVVTDTEADGKAPGVVTRKRIDKEVVVTAVIKSGDVQKTKEFVLKVKKAPKATAKTTDYLFAHFTGTEGRVTDEQIYFATSEDGSQWKDLTADGKPVLSSVIGDKGVRDPYLIRSPEGDKFYLIATDLSIYYRGGWGNAAATTTGSTKLVIWESDNLVDWSEPRLVDVAGPIPEAGGAWGPGGFFDKNTGNYVVYWATYSTKSNVNGDGMNMYYATTRDFYTFSEPVLWIDRAGSIIDTTMIQVGDKYYRASGDGQITIEESDSIYDGWEIIGTLKDIFNNNGYSGAYLEGPEFFKYNEDDYLKDAEGNPVETWGLMCDQYAAGRGYLPFRTTNIADQTTKSWSPASDVNFGSLKKRHGTILPITREEYARVMEEYAGITVDVPEPVIDKTYLKEAIENAVPAADEEKYTEESWSAYAKALENAEKVDADANASQEAIDAAEEELLKAQEGLVGKENPRLPYVDVAENAWYYGAVAYNYGKKTMTGKDATHFAPEETLVRAQFAAVLHKMNGEPGMYYKAVFSDVTEGDWFRNAVLWAADKKIVTGYTGTTLFGANDPVTRSQMATMMYRYAKEYKKYDVGADGDYSNFPDAGDVQEFAVDAMKWAVAEEIITGKTIDGKLMLDPQGSANRAECATIIQRFMEKYEK